jgi:hypothetical protein
MPPHCDSLDGPVVTAARRALGMHDVSEVLPYVKRDGEAEVIAAFDKTIAVRNGDPVVNEVADLYFFETVVRVHRAGEGAPFTGLKPAGLSNGPVIPAAERAIERGEPAELIQLLTARVRLEVERRFAEVMELKERADDSVEDARAYVEASLGLQVWSHGLYQAAERGGHGGEVGEAALAPEEVPVAAHAH